MEKETGVVVVSAARFVPRHAPRSNLRTGSAGYPAVDAGEERRTGSEWGGDSDSGKAESGKRKAET